MVIRKVNTMTSVAQNKQELIEAIHITYKKLRKEFDDIPESLVHEMSMEGQIKNTKMSIHNLLSYLVWWAELMIKWDRIYTHENRIPDLPDTGYTMSDWWKLAERFYKEYEQYEYTELLQKFDTLVDRILNMLNWKTNQELYWIDWYVTKSSSKWYTFGRMIALNTSSPYKNACSRIRKWKKEKMS